MHEGKKDCAKCVYTDGSFRVHMCTKPCIAFENGKWWCAIHCDAAVKKRTDSRRARWDDMAEKLRARSETCVSALAGIHDPEAFVRKVREAVALSYDAMTDGGTCEPTAYWTAIQACKQLSTLLPSPQP